MKKFKLATLGCRTNQYESQAFGDQLLKQGYLPAKAGEEADLCIVNTCTVTSSADSASRHQIRSLLKENPNAQVVVTGCMVEGRAQEVAQIDPRLQIVPNFEKETLLSHLFPDETALPEFQIERFEGHTRAFVKVQDGCNSFCTYCIIPYVRGRSRSRPMGEVIEEVERLVAAGYREVVLTGINVGDFDGGGRLADLVRAVDKVEGLKRLRVSSIDADEVDEDLSSAILEGKTCCPSMHIVLQSGSNAILKRMNRKYTRQLFLQTVERLQSKNPDFTVTTDLIVGFPGETEQDFEETIDLVERVQFAKVHMFPYSPRERTRAFLYPNRIAPEVMRKRKQMLLRKAEEVAFLLRNRFVGKKSTLLLEEQTGDLISGHTPHFLKVWVEKGSFSPNDLIEVELVENRPEGLFARAL